MTITRELISLLALGTIGLAGCSYAGAEADREAAAQPAPTQPVAQQPAEQPAPAPAPTDTATEPTAAPAPSDGGGEVTQPSDEGGEVALPSDGGGALPAPTGIPLVDTSEGTVTYLRAIQNFSPTIESWQITDGQLHYISYTCIGTVDFEAYASVQSEGNGYTTVRWEGNAPGFDQSGEESMLIDETTLGSADGFDDDGPANTHHQAELGEFGRMCSGAGKALAGFVL
ncbi:hypothetical protein [Brachybacterium sp.]|uniref:hypothetical protein n=1 Tax=Brachybacterium sp. TaxID=1891286 RepID=UPI002ED138CC